MTVTEPDRHSPVPARAVAVELTRSAALVLSLVAATVVLIVLGTLVIFTFDPCPANGLAANLPDFCKAVK